jgi:hypothetical protein
MIIRDALGIETDDVANYSPNQIIGQWIVDQRARIIGDWLKAEQQFLA